MCGIVGTITKVSNGFDRDDMTWFQQALIVDVLRGVDSTGLFMVTNDQDVSWAKVASHPLRLLQQKRTEVIFNEASWKGRALVGHNRKATVGNITNENAHPFAEGHIILVHNGSVSNATEVAKEAGVDVEVDSHVIAHLLSTEKDIPAALAKLRGAFAVVWYNQKEHTLNLVRNDDRPLSIAESPRAIYFASEPEMLNWTLSRRTGVTKFSEAKMLEPNKVITFDLETGKSTSTDVEFKEYSYGGFQNSPISTTDTKSSVESGHSKTRSVVPSTPATGEIPKENEIVAFKITAVEKQTNRETGITRHFVQGRSFRNQVFRGFISEADSVDKLDRFQPGNLCTGHVRHLVYRNGVLAAIWVDHLAPSAPSGPATQVETLAIRTFNNLRLSNREWEKLCDEKTCSVCGGNLLHAWPKYTSVNTTGKLSDRIICPECLVDRFKRWTEKEQAWVLKHNQVNPLDYLVEKRALAGPPTIQ